MPRVITLTTDFGTSDGYVASMKGVILGINPQAAIVDVTHAIEPQSVHQASFIIHTCWKYFPAGTINVAVVDPGVGSHRKTIILQTPSAFFVAPDNGILSYVLNDLAGPQAKPAHSASGQLSKHPVPEGCQAVSITKEEYWRHPVSATFHGRDIFAPVAAHISLDTPISEFGEKIEGLHSFPVPMPFKDATGHMVGHIIHIDRFGNLITNLRSRDIPPGGAAVEIKNQRIMSTSNFYAQGSGLMAIVGSTDYLELSIRDGSAAAVLGARIGDTVKIVSASGL